MTFLDKQGMKYLSAKLNSFSEVLSELHRKRTDVYENDFALVRKANYTSDDIIIAKLNWDTQELDDLIRPLIIDWYTNQIIKIREELVNTLTT